MATALHSETTPANRLETLAAMLKLLADPTRLRIFDLLMHGYSATASSVTRSSSVRT
jgi:DNA-binding transcriptional ArsR family regulator